MAHASITLPKSGFAFTSNLVSAVYNINRPVIPAEWMAGSNAGALSGVSLNSTSRISIFQLTISIPAGGDLDADFETGGTWILSYAGFQARLVLGTDTTADSSGTSYFYSTSSLTATTLIWRTIWEKMQADHANGGLTEDPVLTLWDRQGDDPVPAPPPLTFSSEQTISTPASAFSRNSARFAIIPATPRPQLNAAFAPSGEDRYLEQFLVRRDRDGILIHLDNDGAGSLSANPTYAFSDDFLTKGHIDITVYAEGSTSSFNAKLRLDTATILDRGDVDEPYRIDWPTGTKEAIEIYAITDHMNSWSANQRFSAEIKFGIIGSAVTVLPDASAPTSIAVNPVPNGGEGSSVVLGATLSGGVYDELEYRWSVFDGSTNVTSTVLDDHEIATPTFTRPSVSANKDYTIGVRVNAKGTGTKAKSGTSAPVTSLSVTTTVINLVAVSPPNVQMTLDGTVFTDGASINGNEGDISALSVELSGGTYDTIAYIWEVKKLNETALLQAVHRAKDYPWQRPAVHGSNEIVTVSVEISVNGNGTTARPGNVRTQRVAHNTTIFNVADEGIFYGRKKIKNVYYGEKKIVAIYYGEKEVATFN